MTGASHTVPSDCLPRDGCPPPCCGRVLASFAPALLLLACWATASGCCLHRSAWLPNSEMIQPERASQGYTLILPGIFGNFSPESKLTRGLIDADVPTAVEVYDWTLGPWGMPVNMAVGYRTRCQARRAAQKIVAYQDEYPGRPVYLFGHSGGAYAALLTLEALPEDREVTRVFLFGAPISPQYDLSVALDRTEQCIHNFYSTADASVLVVGTSVVGRMDNGWGPSAGAVGFRIPSDLAPSAQWAYRTKLVQHPYTDDMKNFGHQGGHFGWAKRGFTVRWVAPLLTTDPTAGAEVVRLPLPGADGHRAGEQSLQQLSAKPMVASRPAE